MIADGIYSLLLTTSAIHDLVGDRIYPVQAPDTAGLPRILYWQTAGEFAESIDVDEVDPERGSWQIDCQATTYKEAKTLANLVRNLFRNHQGAMGASGKRCEYTSVTNETDVPLSPPDAGAPTLYQTSIDIDIVYHPDQDC